MMTTSCTKIQNILGINTNSSTESDQVLNVAIWSNYLSKEMAEKFSKETGIKLNFSNYATNEELLAKIQTGGSGIDVAVPSDYMVAVMAKLNLLEKLDLAQISEFKNIDSRFLDKEFDPKNIFSIPYSFSRSSLW
jgi:spermidine/putrescine transport system substrate-binding protein